MTMSGDESCLRVFETAKDHLKPEGTFMSIDPAYTEHQYIIAKFLISTDRGKSIRTQTRWITYKVDISVIGDFQFIII